MSFLLLGSDSAAPSVPVRPISRIHITGGVFRYEDGTIFPWRGVTAFLLLRRLLEGDEGGVVAYLRWAARLGYNLVRVFSQVDWKGAPGPSLFPNAYPQYDDGLRRLFDLAAAEGIYIELVGHTYRYDFSAQVAHLDRLNRVIGDRPNLFLELSNEPPVNSIDSTGLYHAVSGWGLRCPWATGASELPAGPYVTDHSPRDDEWPRKAKNAYEFFVGGGPYAPTDPAMKRPIVEDEPMGAGEPGVHYTSARATEPMDFYTYAALSQVMGAGSTFHYQDGLNALIPTANQLACAQKFSEGFLAVDPSAQIGNYDRLDENGVTLRSYIRGSWMIRVRPSNVAPPAGWRALDPWGIVCRRG